MELILLNKDLFEIEDENKNENEDEDEVEIEDYFEDELEDEDENYFEYDFEDKDFFEKLDQVLYESWDLVRLKDKIKYIQMFYEHDLRCKSFKKLVKDLDNKLFEVNL